MQRDDFSDEQRAWPDTGTGSQYNFGSAAGQGGSSFRGGNSGPGGTIAEASLFRGHAGRGPKGYRRPDARIREELSERLMWDDDIDAGDVEIEVRDGVVLLTGSVQERGDKWRIEDLAEQIAGVREVTNRIRFARRGGLLGLLTG